MLSTAVRSAGRSAAAAASAARSMAGASQMAQYEESNYKKTQAGDPSKRAFTYLMAGSSGFVGAPLPARPAGAALHTADGLTRNPT